MKLAVVCVCTVCVSGEACGAVAGEVAGFPGVL